MQEKAPAKAVAKATEEVAAKAEAAPAAAAAAASKVRCLLSSMYTGPARTQPLEPATLLGLSQLCQQRLAGGCRTVLCNHCLLCNHRLPCNGTALAVPSVACHDREAGSMQKKDDVGDFFGNLFGQASKAVAAAAPAAAPAEPPAPAAEEPKATPAPKAPPPPKPAAAAAKKAPVAVKGPSPSSVRDAGAATDAATAAKRAAAVASALKNLGSDGAPITAPAGAAAQSVRPSFPPLPCGCCRNTESASCANDVDCGHRGAVHASCADPGALPRDALVDGSSRDGVAVRAGGRNRAGAGGECRGRGGRSRLDCRVARQAVVPRGADRLVCFCKAERCRGSREECC